MSVTYDCFCVDGISEREMLPQHNVAVTHNTDGGSALVHFPCSMYLHRWLYSTLVCAMCFCAIYFLQVERRTVAAVE